MERSYTISDKLPQGFMNVVKSAGARFRNAFHLEFPDNIDWRTTKHPDFEKDKHHLKEDVYAFVSPDFKKIYVNIEKVQKDNIPYEEIIIHEMGHFLDKHLGEGSYFSKSLNITGLKMPPQEIFAQMVDYVVNNNKPGGPVQTKMYNAVCDKLGIKPIERLSMNLTSRIDVIATEIEKFNPRIALALDRISDLIEKF